VYYNNDTGSARETCKFKNGLSTLVRSQKLALQAYTHTHIGIMAWGEGQFAPPPKFWVVGKLSENLLRKFVLKCKI